MQRPSFWRLTAACNLFDDRYKCGHPLECAGYHSAATEPGRPVTSGSFIAVGRKELVGIGTVLRGRFGGRMLLRDGYAGLDVINISLEIPSGLMRFTEIQISCIRDRLLLAVRPLETSRRILTSSCHTVPVDKS